ncbi:MAG: hypothetical protein HW396_1682 [Candidatus Dadabacteria bacterium]|jgi:hypothetical protein|nr:hypothetical protein [Candidatus Dadabacteria bacterium]
MAKNTSQICQYTISRGNPCGCPKEWAGARPAPTIGEIIGTFKSLCVHDWLKYIKENRINTVGKFWQRNYYEHIIRKEEPFKRTREYILTNPLRWHLDRENPYRKGEDDFDRWLESQLKDGRVSQF